MWKFDEKAVIFVSGELIGGPEDFLSWAEEKHNFSEFRPKPLYLTLTEAGYKNHLNSKKVIYLSLISFYNQMRFFALTT